MSEHALVADGITRRFPGGTLALEDIRLAIPAGQFVSLVGPSGCGKSTLLAILAGLDAPSEGAVRLAGRGAVVFQEAALFPWKTVRQNVALGLQAQRMPAAERDERVDAALRQVYLSRFADAHPHELSGGMRQRAAIARAMVLEPDVLFMDEPFGALDAQTRQLLQDELLALWDRTRPTVVFVTHSLEEAVALSDRIILMAARPGRILADVPVDAPRPRNLRHDGALGRLNDHLFAMLSQEVSRLAAAEFDADWRPVARDLPEDEASGSGI